MTRFLLSAPESCERSRKHFSISRGWIGRFTILFIFLTVALPHLAMAHDFTVGDIMIDHPWARATPTGAKVAGGYVTIENFGNKPDRLISATMEASKQVELHEMPLTDGVMRMRGLPTGILVPAGGRIEMKPGGFHIMFLDLQRQLRQGEKVAGTLIFERAGIVQIEFQVDAIGALGSASGGHQH